MRLIDADALIENHFLDRHRIAMSYADKCWMRKIIGDEPNAVAPIVKFISGKWQRYKRYPLYTCTNCLCQKWFKKSLTKYCPECGAKMDVEE